jgi:hypothetical protein
VTRTGTIFSTLNLSGSSLSLLQFSEFSLGTTRPHDRNTCDPPRKKKTNARRSSTGSTFSAKPVAGDVVITSRPGGATRILGRTSGARSAAKFSSIPFCARPNSPQASGSTRASPSAGQASAFAASTTTQPESVERKTHLRLILRDLAAQAEGLSSIPKKLVTDLSGKPKVTGIPAGQEDHMQDSAAR